MLAYALCLGLGKGVESNREEAKKWLQRSLDEEEPLALAFEGVSLLDTDTEKALDDLKKSSDRGCVLSQFMVAYHYMNNGEGEEDEKNAMIYLKKAASQPLTDQKSLLDYFEEVFPMEKILESTQFDIELKGGKKNFSNVLIVISQLSLGGLYAKEGNAAEAKKWIRKAGDNGLVQAGDLLKALEQENAKDDGDEGSAAPSTRSGSGSAEYQKGLSAFEEEEYEAAVKSFKAGANKGNTDAMLAYAICLGAGKGVGKDSESGKKWLKKAADAGNLTAQALYGGSLLEDEETQKEALDYLKKSADRNDVLGLLMLGGFYLSDDNHKIDEKKALVYLKKAASQPLTKQKTLLDYFEEDLPLAKTLLKSADFKIKLKGNKNNVSNLMIVISQVSVGALFMKEENFAEAKNWFRIARDNGCSYAGDLLEILESLDDED